jgi:hypothetical protein
LKISPLSKPPTIPATIAHRLVQQLEHRRLLSPGNRPAGMSAPTANASLAPDRR